MKLAKHQLKQIIEECELDSPVIILIDDFQNIIGKETDAVSKAIGQGAPLPDGLPNDNIVAARKSNLYYATDLFGGIFFELVKIELARS